VAPGGHVAQFAVFAEDWVSTEMDTYDDHDAAHAALQTR
jgi:hypothetical protein